jgi:hypothetical protein
VSHTFYTDAELDERSDPEFQKFYQNYREVGQKLMPYFGNATIDQAHYYINQLAMYRHDESYSEEIRGVWKPDQQKKLILDVIEALKKMNDNLHPEISSQLAQTYKEMSSRLPSSNDLSVAFRQALPLIEKGKVKRSSFNRRSVAIAKCCLNAWEGLGKQTAPNWINDGSPIAGFIQEIFDILNETSRVVATYRALKSIQEPRTEG